MRDTMQRQSLATAANPHPNDVDRKRIERALEGRRRYRYVAPSVLPVSGGYRIESPCCSRNIDTQGGVIDIALMRYMPLYKTWCLYRMDHPSRRWVLHLKAQHLTELLPQVREDPRRVFWP